MIVKNEILSIDPTKTNNWHWQLAEKHHHHHHLFCVSFSRQTRVTRFTILVSYNHVHSIGLCRLSQLVGFLWSSSIPPDHSSLTLDFVDSAITSFHMAIPSKMIIMEHRVTALVINLL